MTNTTIGSYLKDLRLRKGYSLERVSTETKISLSILRKLEQNDFSTLPNITYIKGFVQNILKTLHVPFTKYEIDLIQRTYVALGLIQEVAAIEETPPEHQKTQFQSETSISNGSIYNIASLKSKRIIVSIIVILAIVGIFRFIQRINRQPDLRQAAIKINQDKIPAILPDSVQTILSTAPELINTYVTPAQTPTGTINNTELTPTVTPTITGTADNTLYPKFEFKKITNLAVSINTSSEDNSNFTLYSQEDRNKVTAGKQNIYITKTDGESWISYKKDDDQAKSILLKVGQKFFITGDKVFLTIGNTAGVKVFYNGQVVDFIDNKGVKSFIFPLSATSEHSLPLFVRDAKDKLYFYQDYLPLMNQEPSVVLPEDTKR